MATSAGLFAYDQQYGGRFHRHGAAQGRKLVRLGGRLRSSLRQARRGGIGARAVGKAAHGQTPLDLDPGQYTVILEASAAGEMLQYLLWSLDARSADEGRSWLSGKDGATSWANSFSMRA